MSVNKEIIMKVTFKVDKGGYVSARIKGVDRVYQMSLTQTIITDEEQARLMFKSVLNTIFDEIILGKPPIKK